MLRRKATATRSACRTDRRSPARLCSATGYHNSTTDGSSTTKLHWAVTLTAIG
jgi:hypothetical protein